MDYNETIEELHHRFNYYNWFIKAALEDYKIVLYLKQDIFYEPHIVKLIMSNYNYKYKVVIDELHHPKG